MPDPDHAPDLDVTIRVAAPNPTTGTRQEPDIPQPEELAALLPGENYTVESFLGAGGMGAVYRGTQVRLQRKVAIKIMRRDRAKDQGFEERFRREALAMAQLNHPNIVNVIDYGEAGPDYLYIVMEFIDGTDLVNVIRSGEMTQETALKLLPQICDALQFAHEHGIVHRDIKPANILLTRDGRIKMADFGLAKRFDAENSYRTQSGYGMGTPDYAAPEQFMGDTNVDHRADIYALGVMIYQMVTGSLPRGAWKPPSEKAAVDAFWDHIVARALQTDPHDRYASVSEIKTDLGGITPTTGVPRLAADGTQVGKTVGMTTAKGSTTALTQAGGRSAAKVQPPASQDDAPLGKYSQSRTPLLIAAALVVLVGGWFAWEKSKHAPLPAITIGTEWTDIVPHINPERDAVRGDWKSGKDGLACVNLVRWSLLRFPVQPPAGDYEVRYKLTRTGGPVDGLFFPFLHGKAAGSFAVDYPGHVSFDGMRRVALQEVKGRTALEKPSEIMAVRKEWIPFGKTCTVLLQVSAKEVRVLVDDVEAIRWQADWSQIQQSKSGYPWASVFQGLNEPIFGLGMFNSAVIYHSIEMRKVPPPETKSAPLPAIAIGPEWTHLVPHIKPERDAIRGEWHMDEKGLHAKPFEWAFCNIPVQDPGTDYDLRYQVTRGEGSHLAMFFAFRKGNTGGYVPIDYVLGNDPAFADGLRWATIEDIKDLDMRDPATIKAKRKEWLPKGKACTVLLQVREKEVIVSVDGEEAFRWPADWSKIQQKGGAGGSMFLDVAGDPVFGIGIYNCNATFHSIEMRRAGEAKATSSAFPVGKWSPVVLNAARPEEIAAFEDGWTLDTEVRRFRYVRSKYGPPFKGTAGGLRGRFRGVSDTDYTWAGLHLRDTGGAGYSMSYLPDKNIGPGRFAIARIDSIDQHYKTTILAEVSAKALIPQGTEYSMEFYAIGSLLIGRLNGQVLTFKLGDESFGSGGYVISNTHNSYYRDLEILPLDGLPEAEALMLAGVDEKGNDLRAKTGAAPAASAATKDAPFVNSLGMKFVPVPITGGTTDGKRVLFSVWETRVQDYEAFVKDSNRHWMKPGFPQGPDHAAVNMTWDDATAFCAWLTEHEHKTGKLDASARYRMPSDHEWSCAVGISHLEDAAKTPGQKDRALAGQFPWGTAWPPPASAGNYAGEEMVPAKVPGRHESASPCIGFRDAFVETSPAGSFPANALGLHELGGNVWEWCEDWYDATQKERVLRGGGFIAGDQSRLLSSTRNPYRPTAPRSIYFGFRCVLELP